MYIECKNFRQNAMLHLALHRVFRNKTDCIKSLKIGYRCQTPTFYVSVDCGKSVEYSQHLVDSILPKVEKEYQRDHISKLEVMQCIKEVVCPKSQ